MLEFAPWHPGPKLMVFVPTGKIFRRLQTKSIQSIPWVIYHKAELLLIQNPILDLEVTLDGTQLDIKLCIGKSPRDDS